MLASLRTALPAVRELRLPLAVRFCRSRAAVACCSAGWSRAAVAVLPLRFKCCRCGSCPAGAVLPFEGCGCLLLCGLVKCCRCGFAVAVQVLPVWLEFCWCGFAVAVQELPVWFCRSRAAVASCCCGFAVAVANCSAGWSSAAGAVLPLRSKCCRCGSSAAVRTLMHLHFQEHCRCRSFNGSCLRISHSLTASDYFQARGLYRRSGFTPCPEDMRMQM